jgi:pyruvoyl-dependent arginine decarboxylase (PvlArgDC)
MIKWEGDLTVGTPVMLVTEESDIVASEGTYNLPEMSLVILVDANGLVAEIEEVTEEPTEEVTEEVIEEMAKQFANQRETFKSEIKSLKATIAEQDKKIANLFELVTGEKKTTTKTTTPTADWKKISLSKTKQK